MARRPSQTVLSFERAILAERATSGSPALLELELRRGDAGVIHVDDDSEASALVDLCVGEAAPAGGRVRFLGIDWATRTRLERLHRRRRIGVVLQTDVWPSQMTIMEAILLPRLYHSAPSRVELVSEATRLARLFDLPGLPVERPDAASRQALVRAGCIRGFLGSPDLVLVHDALLDQAADLAVPIAQAISAARSGGGAVLWITATAAAPAAQFVEADQVYRLGGTGLVPLRRPR